MDLEEFIKNTLVSIKRGIEGANGALAEEATKKSGEKITTYFFGIEPNNRDSREGYISFDVAVTVSQETAGNGAIKIAVVGLGGNVSSAETQEHISRIKFNILPNKYIG